MVCNIRCRNDACFKNNDPNEQTRASNFLPLDAFKSLLDQTASGVEFMWFLNYGEPFLHPQAEDMIAYAKQKNPAMRIASSTNGIPFARRTCREARPLRARSPDVHHRGHRSTDVRPLPRARMRPACARRHAARCDAKRALGLSTPVVQWRYLLFHWNDSAETIAGVKALAAEMGVDELRFYLTHIPAGGATRRLAFGSADHHEIAELADASHGMRPDDDELFLRENQEQLGLPLERTNGSRATPRAGPLRLARAPRPPDTPEADVVVNLPWSTFTTRVAGDGAWASMRIYVPRSHRRSQPVATLATSAWFPADDDLPDIRCLGVMVAEGEVAGYDTVVVGSRAMNDSPAREDARGRAPSLRAVNCCELVSPCAAVSVVGHADDRGGRA